LRAERRARGGVGRCGGARWVRKRSPRRAADPGGARAAREEAGDAAGGSVRMRVPRRPELGTAAFPARGGAAVEVP
jgi:hypothetical protein